MTDNHAALILLATFTITALAYAAVDYAWARFLLWSDTECRRMYVEAGVRYDAEADDWARWGREVGNGAA